MKVRISNIKINPGRREATPQSVEELARSIAAVGLMNPVTLDQNNTLIAGLHRLEAAKLLGWTEIECSIIGMNGVQAELAEIDENIVRTKLTKQELGDQLLRRKELYEMLHPETRQGMRNGQTSKNANLASLETKSFAQDTSEKTGMSKRTVSRLLQIANNMTQDAKRIVQASDLTQDTALKISRLPYDQQAEAASLLAAGNIQSVEQYQQERRERIMAARPSLPPDPVDTRTEEEKERERLEAINGLARGVIQFFEHFLNGLQVYQGMEDDFATMPAGQISQVWHIVGLVDMALRRFIKEIKAASAESESGRTADEKGEHSHEN